MRLQTTVTNNGSATWRDLKEKTYYLLEVKPLSGYLPLEEGRFISRSDEERVETRVITVKNKAKEYELPQTSGNGLTPLYAIGSNLVLSACALYIATLLKKRRANSSK